MSTLETMNAKHFTSPSGEWQNEWAIQIVKVPQFELSIYHLVGTLLPSF